MRIRQPRHDFDPWCWATNAGLVIHHDALPAGRRGEYWPDRHTIVLSPMLTAIQEYCTLSHECGHHALGHAAGYHGPQERAADEWAANQLVSLVEYQLTEALYGRNPAAQAEELGVTPWVIRAYRRMLKRENLYSPHLAKQAALHE